MACGNFRQEFKCKNLLLEHPHPEYFTTSQWRWPPIAYILYRIVAALYLFVWLVLNGFMSGDESFWFIYLTHWTFLMLTLKAVIMAVTAILGHVASMTPVTDIDGSCRKMPWYLKAQWVVYNISTTASLVVTGAYWGLLWTPGSPVSSDNFHVHAVNSMYVLLDLFITATPMRLLHIWHLILYGLLYLLFTLAYCGPGGTDPLGNNYIYGILDFFAKPSSAVLYSVMILVLALPLLWLFQYGIVCLRVFLSHRCCPCGHNYHRHKVEPPPGGSSQEEGDSAHRGHSLEGRGSVKGVREDEEKGHAGEKPSKSNGEQSTVFVTESSGGGQDNKAFDNATECN